MSIEDAIKIPIGHTSCRLLLLDTQTGIFYNTLAEAARIFSIHEETLRNYIKGRSPNKTNLIAV